MNPSAIVKIYISSAYAPLCLKNLKLKKEGINKVGNDLHLFEIGSSLARRNNRVERTRRGGLEMEKSARITLGGRYRQGLKPKLKGSNRQRKRKKEEGREKKSGFCDRRLKLFPRALIKRGDYVRFSLLVGSRGIKFECGQLV